MDSTVLSRAGNNASLTPRNAAGLGRVRVFDLMEGVVVQTRTLQANGYGELVLTEEAFERFGPHVQELVVHAESRGVSANFGFRVLLQYRYNLGAWQSDTSTLLIPATTSATYTIGPAYTDRTKLGRRILRAGPARRFPSRTRPSRSGPQRGHDRSRRRPSPPPVLRRAALRSWRGSQRA